MNLKELRVYYIEGRRYWRMEQVRALQAHDGDYTHHQDVCTGCAFQKRRSDSSFLCREVKDDRLISDSQPLKCQDYEVDEESWFEDGKYSDYTITNDYIFIPATRAGFAQYVAHKLETS